MTDYPTRAIYTPPLPQTDIAHIAKFVSNIQIDPTNQPKHIRSCDHTEYANEMRIQDVNIRIDYKQAIPHTEMTHPDIGNIIFHILRSTDAADILQKHGWMDTRFKSGWFLNEIAITSGKTQIEYNDNEWIVPRMIMSASGTIHINQWCGNRYVDIEDWLPIDDIRSSVDIILHTIPIEISECDINDRRCNTIHFMNIVKKLIRCESSGDLFKRYSKKYVNPTWQYRHRELTRTP